MKRIKDVMTRSVETAAPTDTLQHASETMRTHNIGALPVWYGGQLAGIITDRDITVRAIASGIDPREAHVSHFMTENVISIYEDQSVEEAARLMTWKQVRRLVVLNRNERGVGIVTLSDLAVDTHDDKLVGAVLEQVSTRQRTHQPAYGRILVALDGSKLAEQVLPHVEELALKFGATVFLLRTVTPVEAGRTETISTTGIVDGRKQTPALLPITENLRLDAVSYLQAIEHRLISHGIAVECEYPEGRPAETIVQRARHLGVDLIAMTTHGRTALGRVFFGSVASAVLQTASCPVLLVRVNMDES